MCFSFRYKYFRGNKEEILAKLRSILEKEDNVLLAIVFGSFVELESFRDIDIAVYTKSPSFDYVALLGAKLELDLGIPVDVVLLDELPPRFRYMVLTRGRVIIEKVPGLYEALLSQTIDELLIEKIYV